MPKKTKPVILKNTLKSRKKKKKYSNEISSRLGILIIAFLATVVFAISFFGLRSVGKDCNFSQPVAIKKVEKTKALASNLCDKHIYKGSASIRCWYEGEGENGTMKIKIMNEDLKILPSYTPSEEFKIQNEIIKLIDADSKLIKQLKIANRFNPLEMKISGYAKDCGEMPLVAINYQDGVFNNYLEN